MTEALIVEHSILDTESVNMEQTPAPGSFPISPYNFMPMPTNPLLGLYPNPNNMQPPPDAYQAPMLPPNANAAGPGIPGINPNSSWTDGLKNIREDDIENVCYDNYHAQLMLLAWSTSRKIPSSPDMEGLINSCTEAPWRDKGNVIFFCEGGKLVRCHAIVLQAIIPNFVNQLNEMASFRYSAYVNELPYIPVFVAGVDQRCIEHLMHLVYRGLDYLTGREVLRLIEVLNVLNIYELNVCIAPATPGQGQGPSGIPSNSERWSNVVESRSQSPANSAGTPAGDEGGSGNVGTTDVNASSDVQKVSFVQRRTRTRSRMHEKFPSDESNISNENEDVHSAFVAPADSRAQLADRKHDPSDGAKTSSTDTDGDDEDNDAHALDFKRRQDNEQQASLQSHNSQPISVSEKTTFEKQVLGVSEMPSQIQTQSGDSSTQTQDKVIVSVSPPVRRRRRCREKPKAVVRMVAKRNRKFTGNASPSDGDDEDEADKKKRKRTVYPKGMKDKALAMLSDGVQVREVAEELNVSSKLISRWKYEASRYKPDDAGVSNLNDDLGNTASKHDEIEMKIEVTDSSKVEIKVEVPDDNFETDEIIPEANQNCGGQIGDAFIKLELDDPGTVCFD